MSGKNPIPTRDGQIYEGVNVLVPVGGWQFVKAKRDPTTNDKKYPVGTLWLNTVSQNVWMQTQPAGIWTELVASGSAVVSVNGTTNQITANTVAGVVTLSIPSTFIAPGSIAATTSLTATLGNITATNGNLVLGTAGNKLSIATGSNASIGTSVAMTAGTVTVSTTAVTASSKIFLTANTPGGTQGTLSAPTASIVAGTSFVINSSNNADTSTVNWWIVN